MSVPIKEMVRCFVLAKHVDHNYWWHTPTEEGARILVENVQKVVSKMTGVEIEKEIVDIEENSIRGFIDRYPGKAKIFITSGQSIPWQKFSVVKELSHILYDMEDSYEPDPDVTMDQLLQYVGPFLDGEMSAALLSEHIAEILAMEIYYPLEFRTEDHKFLKDGGDISELVEKRQVPQLIIERCTNEKYIESCKKIWAEFVLDIPTPRLSED